MTDMIYILRASDKNCLLATRLHMARYPNRQPSKCEFKKLMRRFDQNSSNFTLLK